MLFLWIHLIRCKRGAQPGTESRGEHEKRNYSKQIEIASSGQGSLFIVVFGVAAEIVRVLVYQGDAISVCAAL